MDTNYPTEADLPVRSVEEHLRDVAYQHLVEGQRTSIHAMYVESALKAGATQQDISAVTGLCNVLGLSIMSPDQARKLCNELPVTLGISI